VADQDDNAIARQQAQAALAIVNEYLVANQDWKVTPQANGQLQWGFPSGPPTPPAVTIATIPNFLNELPGFSVDLKQYVTGTYLSGVIPNLPPGWSLGGASGLVLGYAIPPPSGNAFYVSPSGSDSNAGTLEAPFATLAHAQSAMQASGTTKTAYVRAGTYLNVDLSLTVADSGETWSCYTPDGYNSAILDSGSSSPTTGTNTITIDGASNVTINGLKIQNFKNWGIGIHGGNPDAPNGWPNTTPAVTNVTISNNLFNNGFTTQNLGWGGGAIYGQGNIQSVTITNNVATNQYGASYRFGAANGDGGSGLPAGFNISNLLIANNVALNCNMYPGDNGAIYLQDENSVSTNIQIKNNFIRDYQCLPALYNGQLPKRDVAIYCDIGVSNVTISGNVIGATANQVTGSSTVDSTTAFSIYGGHNVIWTGNIIDLGTSANSVLNLDYGTTAPSGMTGNILKQNIFLGSWSGTQNSWAENQGPYAYVQGGGYSTAGQAPAISQNMYYNYGSGSLSTAGSEFGNGDSSPTTGVNPLISGPTYTLASNSPAFTDISFPGITGGWGPPGYTIPATGTAPCYG